MELSLDRSLEKNLSSCLIWRAFCGRSMSGVALLLSIAGSQRLDKKVSEMKEREHLRITTN
jgi:hypothetical protein